MRRAVFSVVLAMCLQILPGSTGAATRTAPGPAHEKEAVKGVYAIFQMDREIGYEAFSRTVYDNNTVVYESKTIIRSAEPADSIIDTSTMTLEDDSFFLIDYASSRSAGKLLQSTEIDMYANVAAITTVTNGRSNNLTRVMPAGALCIQSGMVSQLEVYLGRYNDAAGGKQSFLVFDPIGKREYSKVLELMGREETTVNGETRPLTVYELQGEKGLEIKLYVDESRRIIKAENPLQRMVHVLSR